MYRNVQTSELTIILYKFNIATLYIEKAHHIETKNLFSTEGTEDYTI